MVLLLEDIELPEIENLERIYFRPYAGEDEE